MVNPKLTTLLRAKGRTDEEIQTACNEFSAFYKSAEEAAESAWPDKCDELQALTKRWGFTLDELNYDENAPKFDEFEKALDHLIEVMAPFGRNGYDDDSDYWIVDDNYSVRDLSIEVSNLKMDWSVVEDSIRIIFCKTFPEWSVIVRFPDRDDRVEIKKS